MPVVAPFELHDPVAAGRRTRHAHGAHRRLGAGADEADALDRRHQLADALAEVDLERARRAEARAVARHRGQRLDQAARRVSMDERPPRHHVVDERVAVDVFDPRAGGAADEERRRVNGLERADRAVHAPWEDALRSDEVSG